MSIMAKTEREKMLDYAKKMYMSITSTGKHRYSLEKIAEKIEQKFNRKYSRSAILSWIKKGLWDAEFLDGTKKGLELALKKEEDERFDLTEAIGRERESIFIKMKCLNDATAEKLRERLQSPKRRSQYAMSTRDLIALYKATGDAILKIIDVPDIETDDEIVVSIID